MTVWNTDWISLLETTSTFRIQIIRDVMLSVLGFSNISNKHNVAIPLQHQENLTQQHSLTSLKTWIHNKIAVKTPDLTISTVTTAAAAKLVVFELSDPGSNLGKCKGFFSSLKRPDRLWGPPGPLHKEYSWIFKAVGMWGWPRTLHLAPGLRMNGAAPPLPHTPLWCEQGQLYLCLLWDI